MLHIENADLAQDNPPNFATYLQTAIQNSVYQTRGNHP